MAAQIDRSRYNGHLEPFLGAIERQWIEGKTCAQIADNLWPEVRRITGLEYCCDPRNVRYALARIGYLEQSNPIPIPITPTVQPARYVIDWDRMFAPKPNPGRPIDMGGPRDVWIEADPWSNF